jgi:Protein of unknown function (DUF2924)
MPRSSDLEALEAEIDRVRSLGLDGLRTPWRTTLRSTPPRVLTKDLMARMIAWHIRQQTLGGLDAATGKLPDGFARGRKSEGRRRVKSGTVLVRKYQGERHTVCSPQSPTWRIAGGGRSDGTATKSDRRAA